MESPRDHRLSAQVPSVHVSGLNDRWFAIVERSGQSLTIETDRHLHNTFRGNFLNGAGNFSIYNSTKNTQASILIVRLHCDAGDESLYETLEKETVVPEEIPPLIISPPTPYPPIPTQKLLTNGTDQIFEGTGSITSTFQKERRREKTRERRAPLTRNQTKEIIDD